MTASWLQPLAWMYGQAVSLRRTRLKARPAHRLGVPVLSVGNITVGGTGKTEATACVCWILRSLGLTPAVLSRGYRRRSRDRVLVVSDGSGPRVSVDDAGDEPYLLATRLTGVPVVVSTDRIAAGRLAVASLGCDALVLDDGFQRRDEVHRDLDLVLVDAADPFGGNALLPAGRLREPLTALREAGALIVTRADQYDPEPALAQLAAWAPDVPRFTAWHAPVGLVPLGGAGGCSPQDQTASSPATEPSLRSGARPLSWLADRKVLAVSGIARPEAFLRTLSAHGAAVAGHLAFRDHHWFTASDIRAIRGRAQALGCEIVTTSKDATRLAGLEGWILEVHFKVLQPAEGLQPLVEKCLEKFNGTNP